MIVNDLTELRICDVLSRGIANEESIMIAANQDVNLGEFGIFLGIRVPGSKGAIPLRDNMFWFGDFWIKGNDYIFIYTGSGEKRSHKTKDGQNDIYISHWGKEKTVLADHQIVPMLFKVESVVIPEAPEDQPQYKALSEH